MTDVNPDNSAANSGDSDQESQTVARWMVWIRAQLDRGQEAEPIIDEMAGQGVSPERAREMVDEASRDQMLEYEQAEVAREEWVTLRGRHRRGMVVGALYMALGVVICMKAYTSTVRGSWLMEMIAAVGIPIGVIAIIFGFARSAASLVGYLTPISPRLTGSHIPGRRIGSYSPGTARNRFSRFQ